MKQDSRFRLVVQDRMAAPSRSRPTDCPTDLAEMGPRPINAKTRGSDLVIASWSRLCDASKSLQLQAREVPMAQRRAVAS